MALYVDEGIVTMGSSSRSFSSLEAENAFNIAYAFAMINGSEALHILRKYNEITGAVCYGADEKMSTWGSHFPYREVFRWDQEKFDNGELPFEFNNRSTDKAYEDYDEVSIWEVGDLVDDMKVSAFKDLIINSDVYHRMCHTYKLNVEEILQMCDPFHDDVWGCESGNKSVEIDYSLIMEMAKNKDFPKTIMSPEDWKLLNEEDAKYYHNSRIAQLYSEGLNGINKAVKKPISIIHSIVEEDNSEDISIADGHHRVAALALMNCETIECKVSVSGMKCLIKRGMEMPEETVLPKPKGPEI